MNTIKPTVEYLRELRDDGRGPAIISFGQSHAELDDSSTDADLNRLAIRLDNLFGADFGIESAFIFRLEGAIDHPNGRPHGTSHLNFCSGCADDPRHTQEAGPES